MQLLKNNTATNASSQHSSSNNNNNNNSPHLHFGSTINISSRSLSNLINSNAQLRQQATNVLRTMLPMWAANTWDARRHLLQRFWDHVRATPSLWQMPLGFQMSAFITASTTTKASTKHSYAKTLRAVAHKVGQQVPVLDLLVAGLAVKANSEDPVQAVPATREQMTAAMARAWRTDPSGRLAMSLYIAWKTASRWSDVCSLRKAHFIEFDLRRHQVVIEWGTIKTNRRERYRPTAYTVVQEDRYPLMLQQLQRVVNDLQPEQHLSPKTTAQIRAWFAADPITSRLTAHSIKRGALDVLLNVACQSKLDPRLIALLAKHKDTLHEFPAATIRYLANKGNLARMLGTQKATKWL
jgi:integrase